MLLRFVHSTAEESGQWVENADGTHLVLSSSRLVQHKTFKQREIEFKLGLHSLK